MGGGAGRIWAVRKHPDRNRRANWVVGRNEKDLGCVCRRRKRRKIVTFGLWVQGTGRIWAVYSGGGGEVGDAQALIGNWRAVLQRSLVGLHSAKKSVLQDEECVWAFGFLVQGR